MTKGWLHWPFWRPRFEAVIIGRESGNETRLPFIRFRSAVDAWRWCLQMNDANNRDGTGNLAYYEYRKINSE